MREQKILIIGLGKEFGGVESFIEKTCQRLTEKGYHFDFLIYCDIHQITEGKMKNLGCEIYKVEKYSKNPVRFAKEIKEFYREHTEYKIVHCHASHASMVMYTFPIWFDNNRKIVFHSHNSSGNHKALQRWMRLLVNLIADRRLACSQKASAWMFGRKKSTIIYNGIDTSKFKYNEKMRCHLRQKFHVEEATVIGHIGRFEKQKNHRFIIEIFSEALKKNSQLFLVLIGDGELKEDIVSLIQINNLEKKVILLPFQNNIADYYSMMDIFILPSLFEGFPIVGVEAQAAGLPCYFSDNITKEIAITDLANFVCKKKTAADWAEKILNSVDHITTDRAQYADTVGNEFNIDDTIEKIRQVYCELEAIKCLKKKYY